MLRHTSLGDIVDYSVKEGEQFQRVQKGRNDARLNEGEICGFRFTHPFWYAAEIGCSAVSLKVEKGIPPCTRERPFFVEKIGNRRQALRLQPHEQAFRQVLDSKHDAAPVPWRV